MVLRNNTLRLNEKSEMMCKCQYIQTRTYEVHCMCIVDEDDGTNQIRNYKGKKKYSRFIHWKRT